MSDVINPDEAWHRNPWVWLLIAIPALTVAGCMFTIYLALTHPHILVGGQSSPGITTETPNPGTR